MIFCFILVICGLFQLLMINGDNSNPSHHKLNITFEVVYMPSNQERVHNIDKQEAILGVHINRNVGVNVAELNEIQLQNEYNINVSSWNSWRYLHSTIDKRNILNGEIGCYMSHLHILNRTMRTRQYPGWTVVFEDDFTIHRKFLKHVHHKDI